MKRSCETARELLAKKQSQGQALPAWAGRHLAGCRACRDFSLHYPALVNRLKHEFEAVLAPLAEPDLSFLNAAPSSTPAGTKQGKKGNSFSYRSLLPIAAVILVLLGGITGYFGFSFLAPHALLTEENRLFIDNLYTFAPSQPSVFNLLPAEQNEQEAILPAAWFQVTAPESEAVFRSRSYP